MSNYIFWWCAIQGTWLLYMHGVHFFSVHKSSFKVILIEARKMKRYWESYSTCNRIEWTHTFVKHYREMQGIVIIYNETWRRTQWRLASNLFGKWFCCLILGCADKLQCDAFKRKVINMSANPAVLKKKADLIYCKLQFGKDTN